MAHPVCNFTIKVFILFILMQINQNFFLLAKKIKPSIMNIMDSPLNAGICFDANSLDLQKGMIKLVDELSDEVDRNRGSKAGGIFKVY
jgi:hypothetical protein